jgi:hypothetical protein
MIIKNKFNFQEIIMDKIMFIQNLNFMNQYIWVIMNSNNNNNKF